MLRALPVLFALIAALPAASTATAVEQETTRLYLMASHQDFLYWSPDPSDPEAPVLAAHRGCGGTTHDVCVGPAPNGYYLTIPFMPAAVLRGSFEWGPANPARFHLEVDVDSATPTTVHALAGSPYGLHESDAGVEVAPGVFEGTIASGHRVQRDEVFSLGIRVRSAAPARARVAVDIRTGGASWIEFPGSLPVTSVPELLRASTYAPRPTEYVTPDRSFRFNDDDWEVFTFTGNLSETRSFAVPLERKAAVVVGWMDGMSKPFVHGLLNGDPDARKPVDTAFVALASGGADLSRHRYSAAAVDVPAGTLEMRVEPIEEADAYPYTAHLAVIYGPRTLASMRWRFEVPSHQVRLPHTSSCAVPLEQVPATSEVTTFRVDLAGTSPNPLPRSWALYFDVPDFISTPFCIPIGGGGGARFAIGGSRVALVGPGPAPQQVTVSAYDTEFDAEVRYAYTPAA